MIETQTGYIEQINNLQSHLILEFFCVFIKLFRHILTAFYFDVYTGKITIKGCEKISFCKKCVFNFVTSPAQISDSLEVFVLKLTLLIGYIKKNANCLQLAPFGCGDRNSTNFNIFFGLFEEIDLLYV